MCMRAGSFGIGTSLSNDFVKKSSDGKEKSKALNMVIKLSSVDGKPTVKISDDITKVGLCQMRAGGVQADEPRWCTEHWGPRDGLARQEDLPDTHHQRGPDGVVSRTAKR